MVVMDESWRMFSHLPIAAWMGVIGLTIGSPPPRRHWSNFGSPETPEDKITSHSLWDPGEEPEFWTDGGHCRNKDYE